jgi:3-deoxy-7-phosphoheptulonate synthase
MNKTIPEWQGRESHMLGPVPTPDQLRAEFPISSSGQKAIAQHRNEIKTWQHGLSPRLLVMVGQCSIDASRIGGRLASEIYADALFEAVEREKLDHILKIVLRMAVTKPRTGPDWPGLAQTDLRAAVEAQAHQANRGRALTMEVMNEQHFARFGEYLAMGWVGARNVEDTLLRHTISAHPDIPMLYKNSTHPDPKTSMEVARGAARTASAQHIVEVMRSDGRFETILSEGNEGGGVLFRGNSGLNPESFMNAVYDFSHSNRQLVVDMSHANARAHVPRELDPTNPQSMVLGQLACINATIDMIGNGVPIGGVMIESCLIAGRGDVPGQSKTDPCIDLDATLEALDRFAFATRNRSGMDN